MGEGNKLKDGLKMAVKITKSIFKTPLRRGVVFALCAFALIIIFCGSMYDALADQFSKKVSDHVKNNPVKYEKRESEIVIQDETVDDLIKIMENMKIKLEELKLTRDDVAKFYAAEVVSTEINRSVQTGKTIKEDKDKYYGRVYIKRENPKKPGELIRVIYEPDFSKFEQMSASKILEYFSIDEDGKLCVANINDGVVSISHLNYKDNIAQYTVPVEFLIDLCLITQNPKFVITFADKIIKETEIVIQVLQNETEIVTETKNRYQIESELSKKTVNYDSKGNMILQYDSNGNAIGNSKIVTYPPTVSPVQEETSTQTSNMINSEIKIQAVKNWIVEMEYTFNKVTSISSDVLGPERLENEPKGTHSYTNPIKDMNEDGSYSLTFSSIISRKVSREMTITTTTTTNTYELGTSQDVKDKTDDFIKMLKKRYSVPSKFFKEAPLPKLENGAGIFFEMLKNGERTQDLEELMRYILQKATGNDYGVKEFDFSIYDAKDFTSIGSGMYGSTCEEKVWWALIDAGFTKIAAAGAMGNLEVESGFKSNNLENEYESYLGYTDQSYTDAVNNGTYPLSKFISDHKNKNCGAGYGLAQWTWYTRKEGLYNYAKSKGVGIDDENMQIEYLLGEMGIPGYHTRSIGNSTSKDKLNNASTPEEAADIFRRWIEQGTGSAARRSAARKLYEKYKDTEKPTGGTFEQGSSEKGVIGYYTSSSGRKYTVFNQNVITGWGGCCNRAACAIVASGYKNEPAQTLINSINNANRSIYGVIGGNEYWAKYGVSARTVDASNYTPKLRSQLMSGGNAIIWINNNQKAYYGKSGIKWTGLYHWLAIIDYRTSNGVEEMCIADWRGITWVGFDEFETHGVYYMVFVD